MSVIVPVYNVEAYLRRCIDSLLAQEYPRMEIICVDDGSTDASLRILREQAERDSRIRIIHKENGGQASARNAGLDVAGGEWVSFIDSDDWMLPQAFTSLMAHATEDVDIVYYGMWTEKAEDGGSEMLARDLLLPPFSGKRPLLRFDRYTYSVCDKIFRRSVIEQYHIRFRDYERVNEDVPFGYQFRLCARQAAMVQERFYVYYQRAGSTTRSRDYETKRFRANIELTKEVYRFMQEWKLLDAPRLNLFIQLAIGMCTAPVPAESEEDKAGLVKDFLEYLEQAGFPSLAMLRGGIGLCPGLAKAFLSYRGLSRTYRFLYIPLLKITNRGDAVIYRLFGMKVWQRALGTPSR